ncbi:hypothetical protein KPH14_004371 [Odynerus spinipes]|uniref:RRM domain-containing protein n=1 Tax=Odynerus spinipes TaxID=1348599 RepID=A0AAD9RYQ1_9HYME|nr:hypothetical protein KPH14_004371 [Odynerus spinipes]
MEKYCEVCSLELHDEYAYKTHLTGKKHLKNVQHKEFEKRILELSIFVFPIPRSVTPQELIQFFLQFGSIQTYKFGANHLIIEFTSREPVDYLLNNPVWINKVKLNIKRRTLFNNTKKMSACNSMEESSVIDFDHIRNKIFGSIFPKCHTYRFGSTLTGLGFKGCDLDIYMDIGAPIISVYDTEKPWKVTKFPNCWTMSKIFNKVKSIMYRMNNVFADIRPIPQAKTPIIKFCHVPTKISCDISFKNGFGVYNSQLIKHCLSIDNRIKPLIILIKYLARQYEISGCGKMSNYALIILIIFYLQQPNPGLLPPLMEFKKTCEPLLINGWQVNFDENTVLQKINNNISIQELLQGFFEFYINFDFKTNIVCPLDGIIHTKQEFEDIQSLPNYMTQYKEMPAHHSE